MFACIINSRPNQDRAGYFWGQNSFSCGDSGKLEAELMIWMNVKMYCIRMSNLLTSLFFIPFILIHIVYARSAVSHSCFSRQWKGWAQHLSYSNWLMLMVSQSNKRNLVVVVFSNCWQLTVCARLKCISAFSAVQTHVCRVVHRGGTCMPLSPIIAIH